MNSLYLALSGWFLWVALLWWLSHRRKVVLARMDTCKRERNFNRFFVHQHRAVVLHSQETEVNYRVSFTTAGGHDRQHAVVPSLHCL